jgi:hypothetical protein
LCGRSQIAERYEAVGASGVCHLAARWRGHLSPERADEPEARGNGDGDDGAIGDEELPETPPGERDGGGGGGGGDDDAGFV